MKSILGIDIGGTNIRMGYVEEGMSTALACSVKSSAVLCTGENVCDILMRVIRTYIAENCFDAPKAISIGIPGAVSGDRRTIFQAPNLIDRNNKHVMENLDLASPLEAAFGVPVYINKDVNALLSYDMRNFALTGTVIGYYVGTGIGGAAAVNGKLLLGNTGCAMDIGHMSMYNCDVACGCGLKGCAEAIASGGALARLTRKYFPQTGIERVFEEHGETEPVREYLYACALPVSILATAFDPQAIVLGGGVIEAAGFPRKRFEKLVTEHTGRAVANGGMRFLYSEKMPDRGVVGAAILAEESENTGYGQV